MLAFPSNPNPEIQWIYLPFHAGTLYSSGTCLYGVPLLFLPTSLLLKPAIPTSDRAPAISPVPVTPLWFQSGSQPYDCPWTSSTPCLWSSLCKRQTASLLTRNVQVTFVWANSITVVISTRNKGGKEKITQYKVFHLRKADAACCVTELHQNAEHLLCFLNIFHFEVQGSCEGKLLCGQVAEYYANVYTDMRLVRVCVSFCIYTHTVVL